MLHKPPVMSNKDLWFLFVTCRYLSSNALTSLPEGVFASLERLAML